MTGMTEREPNRPMQVLEVQREGMCEIFATQPRGGVTQLCSIAADLDRSAGAGVVSAEYFDPRTPSAGRDGFAGPLLWVLGETVGGDLGGVHLRAVVGADLEPVNLDGRLVGTVIHGPHASECLLAGIRADDTSVSAERQARATFEGIERALETVGMDFSHVARTWLFLDDILAWYREFNGVRTAFFTERGVFDRMVPASTGIGGANPWGAAMMAGAYAVRPRDPRVTVEALPSPLQCPALQYGSSFSRAVEIGMPDLRRIFVSGTAGIGPDGHTRHIGDVLAQTALTCDVIEAILASRGMGWEDVTRATAYVRHPEDVGVLEEHRRAVGMPELPVVTAHNVICRDELLFELEVDAVQAR